MIEYKALPALAAYIDRIGAEQLNFRRFMIKEHRGHYYIERALIKISETGEISCSDEAFSPTAREKEEIRAEIAAAKFPKAIGANSIDALVKIAQAKRQDLYEFWDRKTKTIKMVQQRIILQTGQKAYPPWTFFSDGQWRRMEPGGNLPFWKPREARAKYFMIHEGAKAAKFCDSLVNDPAPEWQERRATHPWAEELAEYEHWGIIGGALSPHRADYEELLRENPEKVVYVCDNDYAGAHALQEVSRHYARSMKGIKFGEEFKKSFDLADDMPFDNPKLFAAKGGKYIYKGPALADMMEPATWATEMITLPGSDREIAVLSREFAKEWAWCVKPEVYVHLDSPHKSYSKDEFNNNNACYSHAKDTSRLLTKDGSYKAQQLSYDPASATGIGNAEDTGLYINTFKGTNIKPLKGDPEPFLEYIRYLVTDDKDRIQLLRWCATLITRPDIRMGYGLLLISETQGIGKTTLGEKILAPLIGKWNCSFPGETDVVDSSFNSWLAHKRLVVINEIYAGNSTKGYDRLKSVITDRSMQVNQKYTKEYTVDNWAHVFACSNSLKAVKLSADDRRWFVPELAEVRQGFAYWERFNHWLTNDRGLRIIMHWATEFLTENSPVRPGETAPESKRKDQVIVENLSNGLDKVNSLLNDLLERHKGQPIAILDAHLVQYIKDIVYDGRYNERIEKPLTIRKWAKSRGWLIGDQRIKVGGYQGKIITNDIRFVSESYEFIRALGGVFPMPEEFLAM